MTGDARSPTCPPGYASPAAVLTVGSRQPNHNANMYAVRQLAIAGYEGLIAATGMFDDEVQELKAAGVQAAFNLYSEAGRGFARHVNENLARM